MVGSVYKKSVKPTIAKHFSANCLAKRKKSHTFASLLETKHGRLAQLV